MPHLFSPLTVGDVTMRNRLWVAPMCQYSAVDGVPQEWHHTHLAQFASGGAGLVMAEATAVSPEGRISPEDAGIWNDAQRDAWAPIAAAIRSRGAVAGMQLAHAGRKGSTWSPLIAGAYGSVAPRDGGWAPVAPSAVAFEGYARPVALDLSGIDAVVADFAAAARRAAQAGFQVVEVHAGHGYLLHQFLSQLANRRTDEYGGSLENRARLLLRVVSAVREAVPDLPVFVRLSGTDWTAGGWTIEETTVVAGWAAERGADFFDISSGGAVPGERIPVSPGYQVP
ncbi:MAG: oxidoreductase, partial [Microbacteriaceae bacterium]